MTSSNGNIFRVTDPLCGKFIGHRWIPRTKASNGELWCFLWSAPKISGWANNREAGDLRRRRDHYYVIIMEPDSTCRSVHVPSPRDPVPSGGGSQLVAYFICLTLLGQTRKSPAPCEVAKLVNLHTKAINLFSNEFLLDRIIATQNPIF